MENKKIVLLAGEGQSTKIVFNSINEKFGVHLAIIENKESTKVFIKRRIKRLGYITVFGQIIFQTTVSKFLNKISKQRQLEIIKENQLNTAEIPLNQIKKVSSINSSETIDLLKEINPDLIIVNGTRIISKKVLTSVGCSFINTHAGITPKYRGVHGTYWALVNNDIKNSGVTVHFVDQGIDTGNIISQSQVIPTNKDNFATYPLIQLAVGVKLLNQAITDHFNIKILTINRNDESNLYYHPTIWKYLYYRFIKKEK